MNRGSDNPAAPPDTVLIVEDDVLVRTSLAAYLRDCGYRVIEATSTDEAITALTTPGIVVDIVFSAVEMTGSMDGFSLAQWVRANRPNLQIVLAGSLVKAAHAAGDLCEEGPHLQKPYEPQQAVEWIKRLKNLKS